jgi:uncharacterized protein (DUF983 family)
MFSKGSKMYSILHFKCPECHEGDFFESHPYNLKKTGNTTVTCSECGMKYEKEIGFYYGAMYISYAFGVALFVTFWVLHSWFFSSYSVWWLIGIITVASVLLGPLMYHTSKIVWANIFFRYKGKKN